MVYPNDREILHELTLLDVRGTKYNVSAYYINKEGELSGLLEIQNWEAPITGSSASVKIPAIQGKIDAENYEDFTDFMKTKVEIGEYGLFIR